MILSWYVVFEKAVENSNKLHNCLVSSDCISAF